MDWFKDLYDDFRMKTGFGSIPEEETKKEVHFILDVLNLSENSKILDLFCGTGRHSIELTKKKCVTTGIEYNSEYIKIANDRASKFSIEPKFIQGDVRYVDFRDSFDAAIIMYQSFGYFDDFEEKNILKKVYSSLKSKGRFLIEILNRDYILKHFSKRSEKEIEGIKIVEEREFDILKSRVNSKLTRYHKDNIITKNMSWRLYSVHEIKNILEDIGFNYIVGYSNLNKEPLSLNTRLMRLVFEKN